MDFQTYIRSDGAFGPQTMGSKLTINNSNGLTVGTANDLQVYVSGANVCSAGPGNLVLTKNTVFCEC